MIDHAELKRLHPDLDTTARPPTLIAYLGTGTRLYGHRDTDRSSQSFVQTLFLTLFFIPIFPLAAYRVARNGKDLLLLGKVPVSSTARKGGFAALASLLAIATTGAVYGYLQSDGYINGQRFATAQQDLREGRYVQAIDQFKRLMLDNTDYKQAANEALQTLLAEPQLSQIPSEQLADVIKQARSISRSFLKLDQIKLHTETLAVIERIKTNQPTPAHQLLHSIEGLNKDAGDLADLDETLLKASIERDRDLDAINEYALLLEARGNSEGLHALLTPNESMLGDGEGARIQAQLLVAAGEYERAYPLFSAYMGTRLKALTAAEQNYQELQRKLWDKEFQLLNQGKGPATFYTEYEATSDADKEAFVNRYIANIINNSKAVNDALEEYRKKAVIVPAALDYGIVLLRRGQGMSDEAARAEELKKAEATFLAVRGVAGDTDQYRLYLGQVYYWLGKHDEGHAEFEALLSKYQRSPETLLGVAQTLRNLGIRSEATALAKEAFDSSSNKESTYAAAHLLFLMANSIQERISWLEKADTSLPSVAMDLSDARGQLAEQNGDEKQAAKYYREAIRLSETLPVNATTYNNTALVYSALARVTRDAAAVEQGATLMRKAVELNPSDAILLSNASEYLLNAGLRSIFAGRIDFIGLQLEPSLDALGYLYEDDTGWKSIREQVRQQPLIRQSIDYLSKSILLAPKEARNYFSMFRIASFIEDAELLQELDGQLSRNAVDLSAANAQFLDFVHDRNQSEQRKLEALQLERYRELSATNLPALSRAVAYSKLAESLLQQSQLGGTEKINEALTAAERAEALVPSSANKNLLIDILLTKASLDVARHSAAYQELRASAGKVMPEYVIAMLILQRKGLDQEALASHPTLIRAVTLLREQLRRFPEKTNLAHWALLSSQAPVDAERMANNIRNSRINGIEERIAEHLYPLHPVLVVNRMWRGQVRNQAADLKPLLARLEQQQIPLPLELLQQG